LWLPPNVPCNAALTGNSHNMQFDRLPIHAKQLFDVSLSAAQLEQFAFVATEMLRWNDQRGNLTAITAPDEIETRHFLDSLSMLLLDIPINAMLVDVGTGAGFPGLVLKITRPDIKLALVESVGKKTAFLQHITDTLGLQDVIVLNERAETIGQDLNYREQFDLAVARSLAHMPVLIEYLMPLVRPGGRCVAMKGASALRELHEARAAIEALGGGFSSMRTVSLPGVEQTHALIALNKKHATPSAFPRRVGVPAKRPILPAS
jgi:16S rRNA (guanine527-N7)-methyltransferase